MIAAHTPPIRRRASMLALGSTLAVGWFAVAADRPSHDAPSMRTSAVDGPPTQGGIAGAGCNGDTLSQSLVPTVVEAENSVYCGDANSSAGTSLARSFGVIPTSTAVTCVNFGVNANVGAPWPVEVRILAGSIDGTDDTTLLYATSVEIPSGTLNALFTVDFPPVPITAGTELVVELRTPTRFINEGGDGGLLVLGCNNDGETAPTYIRATTCGVADFIPTASIGFPQSHLVMTLGFAAITSACDSGILNIDPSFESNPLLAYAAVLNDFTQYEGSWGGEVSSIVTGSANGVTPYAGSKMLCMSNDGLTVTQAVQVIDMTSLATQIDLGQIDATFAAHFNAPSSVAAASSYVLMRFYSAANLSSQTAVVQQSLILDALPSTWERNELTAPIPAGTRWMVMEFGFTNASIGAQPGYVDDAEFCTRDASSFPPECRVYWARAGDPSGARLTTAEYDGANPATFDPVPPSVQSNPHLAFDTTPATGASWTGPTIYWKENGLLWQGDATLAPTVPVVIAAAPCSTQVSHIATSPTDVYMDCQQNVEVYRITKASGVSSLVLGPSQLGTVRALAFNPVDGLLYVARDQAIWRYSPGLGTFTAWATIPPLPSGSPPSIRGMDFDHASNALIVLGKFGNGLNPEQGFIIRIPLVGSPAAQTTLLLDDPSGSPAPVGFLLSQYRGIAVDGPNGYMWWTCDSPSGVAQVRRAALGSSAAPLVIATGSATEEFYGITVSRCGVLVPPTCTGDLTGDGFVDAADLGSLLGAWGTGTFDLDGDGITDAADLSVMLGGWGACQ